MILETRMLKDDFLKKIKKISNLANLAFSRPWPGFALCPPFPPTCVP
jgi:hypothetical protein